MTACCPVRGLGYKCECSTPSAPTEPAWCDCKQGQRATVTLTLLPRPLPMFGGPVQLPACPACYAEKRQLGQVLRQQAAPVSGT